MNTYDTVFIFSATMTDEALDKALESVQQEIARLNGSIARTDKMGRRPFARPIRKRSDGLYARMWIKLAGTQVQPLMARFKLNEEIVRVQMRRIEGEIPPPAAQRATTVAAAAVEGARDGEP